MLNLRQMMKYALLPLLIVIFALVSVSIFAVSQFERTTEEKTITTINSSLYSRTALLRNYFDSSRRESFSLTQNPLAVEVIDLSNKGLLMGNDQGTQTLTTLKNYLFSAVYDSGVYETVVILNKHGGVLLDATSLGYDRLNFKEMPYHQAAMRGNRTIQDIMLSSITDQPILITGNPILNFDNEIIGSAGLILKFDKVREKILDNKDTYISYGILDKTGEIIASDGMKSINELKEEIFTKDVFKTIYTNKKGFEFVELDKDVLLVYSVFPEKNWYFYGVIRVEDYMRELTPIKRIISIGLIFLIIIVTAFIISAARLKILNDEYKKTLRVLKETQQQLVITEKLASLGPLVSGVSHELNTPLGNCVMATSFLTTTSQEYIDSIHSGTYTSAQLAEYGETFNTLGTSIQKNLDKAVNLINSFKRIASYKNEGVKSEINLCMYLSEVIVLTKSVIRMNHLNVMLNCQENLIIYSYPDILSEIVRELLENTVLHAFDDPQDGLVTISVEASKEQFTLKVSDNGKGLDSKQVNRIFDPFYTTKMSGSNSGLGLYNVYNSVVQILSGTIDCHSTVGNGTEFVITIPK